MDRTYIFRIRRGFINNKRKCKRKKLYRKTVIRIYTKNHDIPKINRNANDKEKK